LWPERDGDLSTFMQRMANMHKRIKGNKGDRRIY